MVDPTPAAGRPSTLKLFLTRQALAMLALGFAAGLPFLLIFDTLSAWLRSAGLSLEVISFFTLATIAYAFKFLWAPIIDRTRVPGLHGWLGHRRAWMLVTQGGIIVGLALIALTDPLTSLPRMAGFAVMVGFISATQDIVIDAWRIEVAAEAEQGVMAAAYQWGYRIAFIVAGAAPLYLADIASWSTAYLVMAGLMVFGVIGVLFAPAEKIHVIPAIPKIAQARPVAEAVEWALRLVVLLSGALILGSGLSGKGNLLAALLPDAAGATLLAAWTAKPNGFWLQLAAVVIGMGVVVAAAWPLPGTRSQPSLYLSRAFGEPLGDFFRRFGGAAGAIIALICFYRITEFVLNLMNPFYIDVGFTLTEIAEVRKVYGTAMNIIGTFLGGYAIARWGLMRPLIIGAVIAPLSNLSFAWLSTQGPSLLALTATISVQNVAQSFAAICLIAYMSSLTSAGFTATQYALFTSLYALPDKIIATQSGRIVEAAARSAETGGLWAPLKSLFVALPSESYAAGAAKMGLGPAALGAGYFVFFIYTFAIGLIVIPLALWARRQSALNARID